MVPKGRSGEYDRSGGSGVTSMGGVGGAGSIPATGEERGVRLEAA
jgi:hypothetical protein